MPPTCCRCADLARIATGRGYAGLARPEEYLDALRRRDADRRPRRRRRRSLSDRICLLAGRDGATRLWIEDNGRWFAGPDGRPARAHGVVRVINERHEHERAARLSVALRRPHRRDEPQRADRGAGSRARRGAEVSRLLRLPADRDRQSRAHQRGLRLRRRRRGDRLGRPSASARRMRGGDLLGRFSGNKFGIMLNTCTPDDLPIAADRLLAGVRDDVVQTAHGPVAATVTIGGVTAPRHARTVDEILAHAQESLDAAKAKRRGSFVAYRPNVEREALRRTTCAPPTRSSPRSTSGASCSPSSRWSRRRRAQPAFYECLMRIRRADGTRRAGERGDPGRRAARAGAPARPSRARAGHRASSPPRRRCRRASTSRRPRPSIRTGGRRSARCCARNPGVARAPDRSRSPRPPRSRTSTRPRGFVARVKDLGCRIAIDDFGAGYTSFRNLRKLGVDMVKIDGAFVQNLTRSEDDRAFVRTLIDLGRAARARDRRRMGAGRGRRRDARRTGAATTCRARWSAAPRCERPWAASAPRPKRAAR